MIGVAVTVFIAAGVPTVISLAGGSTNLDPLQVSVARYIDATLGVYSPLATSISDNATCAQLSCTLSGGIADSPTQAIEQLSDVQVADPSSINWTSPTIVAERFNVGLLKSRNNLVFHDNATPKAIGNAIQVGNAFIANEASYLSGNLSSCATHICVITSGAGASVISFESEAVSGNTATIQAVVREWQQSSVIDASGQLGPWNTAANELNDTFSLLESNGTWFVNSVSGSFLPGQGP